ncbi:MAG: type IV toxin-antitoxin system AbiEi family antitoxin domain-containing protein [Candidatus Hydrogenedentes bacterium]|nr:type IV toxin-antitoxin system AbiEi family antitoxin domain-containing protein [Candidatus Hydrogenedentota bacterium]
MSTIESIRAEAMGLPVGQPATSRMFLHFGSRAAVDQALSRLVKEGALVRPARGVYMRPVKNAYVGDVPPEPERIAEVIARETGSVIQVHGAEAARRMGLSTQVPMRPVFYTSGPTRNVRLGRMNVLLKRISPRKLALTGRPAGVALTALWYLGKNAVDIRSVERIRERLGSEEFAVLKSASSVMPGWMHDVFIRHAAATADD